MTTEVKALHTPGKLNNDECPYVLVDEAGERVFFSTARDEDDICSPIERANARRGVALWNACLDIPTPVLEQVDINETVKALDALALSVDTSICSGAQLAAYHQAIATLKKWGKA